MGACWLLGAVGRGLGTSRVTEGFGLVGGWVEGGWCFWTWVSCMGLRASEQGAESVDAAMRKLEGELCG